MNKQRGWGKNGKIAADPSVINGGVKGAAARAQSRRKNKVPLSLAPTWGTEEQPAPPPPIPPPPPRRMPGAKWGHQ